MSNFSFRGLALISVTVLLLSVIVISCSKSSDSATSQFLGKWNGQQCNSVNTTYTFSTGPTNYTMYMNYTVGVDTCAQNVTLLASVSSDAVDNFSIGTQRFVDKCGNDYSISAGGTISGDSIIITTYTQSSLSSTPVACTFRGVK